MSSTITSRKGALEKREKVTTMSKYKDLARHVSGESELTRGKTKITTKDIIERYPEGFSICAVDLFGKGSDAYAVLNIVEDKSIYLFGGKALTELVTVMLDNSDPNVLNNELADDPLRLKLTTKKTKAGRDFTCFTVLD